MAFNALNALQNLQRYLFATSLVYCALISGCHHQDPSATSTVAEEPASQGVETMKLSLQAESGTVEPRGAGHYLIRLNGVMESSALVLGTQTLFFASQELFTNVTSWSASGDLAAQLPALMTIGADGADLAAGRNRYRLTVSRVMEHDPTLRSLRLDVVPGPAAEMLDQLAARANGDTPDFSSVELLVALVPPPPVFDPFGDSGPSSELHCSTCKFIQQYMASLPRPRPEAEITQDLERSCVDIIPAPYRGVCAMVLEAAGHLLLQEILINPDNPFLCHQVRMCPQ